MSTDSRTRRLQFERYVLDLDRGCLFLRGSEVTLRPKTFAVLHHLIENCGRLVSKEELFAAVWPNLVVTDDVLVQSIGELRRALGSDGPRLIKTVPKRGYRFDSDLSVAASNGEAPADAMGAQPASDGAMAAPPASDDATPTPVAPDNEVQSQPSPGARLGPVHSSAAARAGLRTGLFASFLLILLAAATLWSGIATDWKFRRSSGEVERSSTGRPDARPRAAIAILPFRNQSDDSTREYFAEGLTQDIINALGRFPELTVMSWNAVLPYKGSPASPEEVARRLAVHYQVEGSVLRTGDRVRVMAQLVSSDGRVLWSARFDEPLADLFALHDRITTEIAGALAAC